MHQHSFAHPLAPSCRKRSHLQGCLPEIQKTRHVAFHQCRDSHQCLLWVHCTVVPADLFYSHTSHFKRGCLFSYRLLRCLGLTFFCENHIEEFLLGRQSSKVKILCLPTCCLLSKAPSLIITLHLDGIH